MNTEVLTKEWPSSLSENESETKIPVMPRSVKETGLDYLFLVELLSKVLFLRGRVSLSQMADHVKLTINVLEELFAFMRTERICELVSRGDSSATTFFQLTEAGRTRAREFMNRSQYAGPAPVNLEDYSTQINHQKLSDISYTRDSVAKGFDGYVLQDGILEQLGAAMNSSRSIFMFGPAGSGKTYIAETLVRLLEDDVAIPYAILVDDEIIQLYDPLVHQVIEQAPSTRTLFNRKTKTDQRWLLCKRPIAISGGELTLATLDLEFDRTTRYYQAPPHMKANNGLYIVDDLGHQTISPRELMNRWIVPLDRRRDYLSLHTGYKFQIPFDVKVVFSSNLSPDKLADDAFLRRLGYKIYVGALSEEKYKAIFQRCCKDLSIPYSESVMEHLLNNLYYKEGKELLASNPGDLLGQVRDLAIYEERPPTLTVEAIEWAWHNFFATPQPDSSFT